MKSLILEGEDLEKLLKEAAEKFGLKDIHSLKYEILEVKKKGLLFKKEIFKVKIESLEEEAEEEPELKEEISLEEDSKKEFESQKKKRIDGRFEINVKEDGIYLIVYPPQGGREVQIEEVLEKLNQLGVQNAILPAINEAITFEEVEVKIAEYDPKIYRDAEVRIKVKNRGLEAYAYVTRPRLGKDVTQEMIYTALESSDVFFGIIPEAIQEIVEKKIYEKEVLVARGIFPENGEDAQLIFNFEIKENRYKPKELPDGKVDFHELDYIVNATAGEVLVNKIPPTPGKEGKTVKGEILPPKPGKDKPLPQGKNTKISEDGLKLISEIDGQIIYDGKSVKVVPVCEVNGDVDYSVGNLEFVGTIIIKGSILDDFQVIAEEDIIVKGNINKAMVQAGRDVICERGIILREKGIVKAGRNIKAKFVENGVLEAGESIEVVKAIMHSKIKAGKEVRVTDPKGVIVGGEIIAGKLVSASIIGSEMATRTELKVGINPEIVKRIIYIEERLKEIEKNMPALEKILIQLKKDKEFLGPRFPKNKQELMKKTYLTYKQYQTELPELKTEKENLEIQINNTKGGEVRAYTIMHPNCIVTIRKATKIVQQPIKAAVLIYENGEVTIGQYIGRK